MHYFKFLRKIYFIQVVVKTCNFCAEIRESCPMEIFKDLKASSFFFSNNQAAKAAPIASATGSVRLTGSPSTPATATPRMSLQQSRDRYNANTSKKHPCSLRIKKLQKFNSYYMFYNHHCSYQWPQLSWFTCCILFVIFVHTF